LINEFHPLPVLTNEMTLLAI